VKLELDTNLIDPHALDIVEQLQRKSFTTYLVGGCVRDLLVGIKPKDFDIVTMALPEQVQKIIRPSHLIGRRFRLVLVRRYGQQFEISTFRALNYQNEDSPEVVDENIYGEPKEDALRRDFTINGLFYDPSDKQIFDYTDGLRDIKQRVVRMIGDPLKRIEQDPIRILRALRFAHKVGFSLDTDLRMAIIANPQLLKNAVLPRVREEILKIMRLDDPSTALWEAYDLQILKTILPTLHSLLEQPEAAKIFFHHLDQGVELVRGATEPVALYSVFMYSYLATVQEGWSQNLSARLNESLDAFMRLELGMHRVESELFLQGVNLVKQLGKHSTPEKMRARHRDHLLTNRSFELALCLASAYHHMGLHEIHQWKTMAQNQPPPPQKDHRRRP
jgi:poly(A) polymerase